jgi:hypothetical protein
MESGEKSWMHKYKETTNDWNYHAFLRTLPPIPDFRNFRPLDFWCRQCTLEQFCAQIQSQGLYVVYPNATRYIRVKSLWCFQEQSIHGSESINLCSAVSRRYLWRTVCGDGTKKVVVVGIGCVACEVFVNILFWNAFHWLYKEWISVTLACVEQWV